MSNSFEFVFLSQDLLLPLQVLHFVNNTEFGLSIFPEQSNGRS